MAVDPAAPEPAGSPAAVPPIPDPGAPPTPDPGAPPAAGPATPAGAAAPGPTPTPAPSPEPEPPVAFSVVDVVSVELTLPSQFPVVTVRETDPPYRSLSLPIGLAEGTALAQALHQVPTPRPMTHELFATVLARLGADVVAVRLVGRTGGLYLAELQVSSVRGREVVPCRPSDGLILAVRQAVRAPVLVDRRLLATDGDVTAPASAT